MSETTKYEHFAWMAPYIHRVRPMDNYLEFSFPPASMTGRSLPLIFFNEGYLPVLDMDKTTHLKVNLTDDELFKYLLDKWREWNSVDNQVFCIDTSKPPQTPYCSHFSFKYEFTPDEVEIMCSDDDALYLKTICAMDDKRLTLQLDKAVELENYEHAAIIKKELEGRK